MSIRALLQGATLCSSFRDRSFLPPAVELDPVRTAFSTDMLDWPEDEEDSCFADGEDDADNLFGEIGPCPFLGYGDVRERVVQETDDEDFLLDEVPALSVARIPPLDERRTLPLPNPMVEPVSRPRCGGSIIADVDGPLVAIHLVSHEVRREPFPPYPKGMTISARMGCFPRHAHSPMPMPIPFPNSKLFRRGGRSVRILNGGLRFAGCDPIVLLYYRSENTIETNLASIVPSFWERVHFVLPEFGVWPIAGIPNVAVDVHAFQVASFGPGGRIVLVDQPMLLKPKDGAPSVMSSFKIAWNVPVVRLSMVLRNLASPRKKGIVVIRISFSVLDGPSPDGWMSKCGRRLGTEIVARKNPHKNAPRGFREVPAVFLRNV